MGLTAQKCLSFLQSTVPLIITVVPDFSMAAIFIITWISPYAFQETMVKSLMLVMLLEFIIMHSSVFMGGLIFSRGKRSKKILYGLVLSGFYSIFAAAFSLAFKTWWPILAFWGLTLNRLMGIILSHTGMTEYKKKDLQSTWGVSVAAYIIFVIATTVIPLPALGITPECIYQQAFTGEGVWIDEPYRVLCFGFLYYAACGLYKMKIFSVNKCFPPYDLPQDQLK
ncbi:MAG: hypothetical protein Q8Q33_03310 [Chlamydiota bacterium]|nr:hypothetical protein [Chlamydiota bacterium]